MKKRYNWKNWKVGERVRPNPSFNWSHLSDTESLFRLRGTVTNVRKEYLRVKWDDDVSVSYSYADSSLTKIAEEILPDELFEI